MLVLSCIGLFRWIKTRRVPELRVWVLGSYVFHPERVGENWSEDAGPFDRVWRGVDHEIKPPGAGLSGGAWVRCFG